MSHAAERTTAGHHRSTAADSTYFVGLRFPPPLRARVAQDREARDPTREPADQIRAVG